MPPYRLTDRNTPVMLGADYVVQRPALLALIAEIIVKWSAAELQLGTLLGRMFHTSPVAAMGMYLAIKNPGTKRDVLLSAAEQTLWDQPEKRELFQAVATLARSCEKERDKFAHRVLGIVVNDPTLLVVVEPSDMLRLDASMWAFMREAIATKAQPKRGIKLLEPSMHLVYSEQDLHDVVTRLDRVREHLARLYLILDPDRAAEAAQECAQLRLQPEIAQILPSPKNPP